MTWNYPDQPKPTSGLKGVCVSPVSVLYGRTSSGPQSGRVSAVCEKGLGGPGARGTGGRDRVGPLRGDGEPASLKREGVPITPAPPRHMCDEAPRGCSGEG